MIKDIEITKSTDNVEHGFILANEGKVWYKIIGKNKTGIPLLVLHGGPGASHAYLQPLEKLATERTVVFYDQLGCGNSDRPANPSLWTIDHFVEELHQVQNSLGLGKVHILGQSWGTSLAVEYILTKAPEGVKSLILSGPLLSTSRWAKDQKAYIAELPQETREIILQCEKTGNFDAPQYQDAMMQFYNLHVCRLDTWPDCLNHAFSNLNMDMYQYMWGPSEFSITGTLQSYDRVDSLSVIDIPVLFTCGEYDESTPTTTRYYQKNIPGSEIYIFADSSHEHHLEKPQEYLHVVRDFLYNADKGQKATISK